MEISINWNDLFIYLLLGFVLYYLYKKYVFPSILNRAMKMLHAHIHNKIKKKIFAEAFERVNNNSKTIEVLEIGVGTGENFKLYPQNTNVSFVDKTDDFLPYLKESFEKDNRQNLNLIITKEIKGEDMKEIESNSKDVVVHTFILCSVDDPKLVLKEIQRILKPNGICVFIEHSLEPKNSMRRFIQKLIGPIWFCLLDCRFRPMKSVLESGDYSSLKIDMFEDDHYLSLVYPIVYGIGTKL